MSGGFEELVVNPNERAVSIDIMRLQRFKGADLAELWRAMIDTGMGTDDLDADGLSTPITTQNSPVAGEVLGGLVVQPQIGNLSLLVAPGVAFVYDPDSPPNSDESQYKYVRDSGIATAGVLSMTGNTGGSTRIDVIECSRVAGGYNVLETDNRDIFSNVTGLFTPTTVNKVTAGAFQYRVRQGTAGGGFPGTAAGWLPLAIASVPNGTTTNDQITFWDVRPLIADRVRAPFTSTRDQPEPRGRLLINQTSYSGKSVLTGYVDAVAADHVSVPSVPGMYRLGGRLRTGSPGLDLVNQGSFPDGIDLQATANQSGTWSSGTPVYIYLLEPLGLPRWARYTDAVSGARKPRSPRGFVVASTVAPLESGTPSATIALPAATGLSASTSKGICIAVSFGGVSQSVQNLVGSGDMQYPTAQWPACTGTVNAAISATVPFVAGTHYPANAKEIMVVVNATFTGGSSGQSTIQPQPAVVDGSGNYFWEGGELQFALGVATSAIQPWAAVFRIPILPNYGGESNVSRLQMLWNAIYFAGGSVTVSGVTGQVVAYRV